MLNKKVKLTNLGCIIIYFTENFKISDNLLILSISLAMLMYKFNSSEWYKQILKFTQNYFIIRDYNKN